MPFAHSIVGPAHRSPVFGNKGILYVVFDLAIQIDKERSKMETQSRLLTEDYVQV